MFLMPISSILNISFGLGSSIVSFFSIPKILDRLLYATMLSFLLRRSSRTRFICAFFTSALLILRLSSSISPDRDILAMMYSARKNVSICSRVLSIGETTGCLSRISRFLRTIVLNGRKCIFSTVISPSSFSERIPVTFSATAVCTCGS